MAKNNKKSEIDEIVNEYFQILEEDLGLSYIYQDLPDNEVNKRMKENFKYFKAGFLFANINAEQVLNKQNALDFYFFMSGGD